MSIITQISENQAVSYNDVTVIYNDPDVSYGGGSADNRQLFDSDEIAVLQGVVLAAPVSAANVVIRDGLSSGDVILTLYAKLGETVPIKKLDRPFTKGMHVKLDGEGATCSLITN